MDPADNPMPTGISVLHYDGGGTAPVVDILESCEAEADPAREGIRVLLAVAVSLLPSLSADELVTVAPGIFPELGQFDPAVIADVAARLRAV